VGKVEDLQTSIGHERALIKKVKRSRSWRFTRLPRMGGAFGPDKRYLLRKRKGNLLDRLVFPSLRHDSRSMVCMAMLRTPSGTTIETMMHATWWQQHSIRGFLASVVVKKLGLNLVSVKEAAPS
jgi:hypothetical protein